MSKPVLLVTSITVGLKSLLATAAITELLGVQATGIILGVLLAFDVALANYLRGQVVPLARTITYEDEEKQARAGGAAGVPTGYLVSTDATVTELLEADRERGTPG